MNGKSYKTVMMEANDSVAVALEEIPSGAFLKVECQGQLFEVELVNSIQFGHKFAVVSIKKDEDIVKYGEIIGIANQDISVGEHVHVHNLDGKRGRGDLNDSQERLSTKGV